MIILISILVMGSIQAETGLPPLKRFGLAYGALEMVKAFYSISYFKHVCAWVWIGIRTLVIVDRQSLF